MYIYGFFFAGFSAVVTAGLLAVVTAGLLADFAAGLPAFFSLNDLGPALSFAGRRELVTGSAQEGDSEEILEWMLWM